MLIQMVRRLFNALVGSEDLRQGVYPTSADGVAAAAVTLTADAVAWTWGAWAQIVAAVGMAAETQIVGFSLENFVGAASQGEVQIGSGAGAAEVALATCQVVGAVYMLPKPIRVPAATRLAARYRTSTAVADTVDIKLVTLTGF